jgi:hypothetical protein
LRSEDQMEEWTFMMIGRECLNALGRAQWNYE